MPVVVYHQRVADALGIEARTGGAKRSQAHGEVEDPVGMRTQWCEAPGTIVRAQPFLGGAARQARSGASREAGSACCCNGLQNLSPADVHTRPVQWVTSREDIRSGPRQSGQIVARSGAR